MVAIDPVWQNFLGIHKMVRVTLAMAASLSTTVMDWSDIVEATDAETMARVSVNLGARGTLSIETLSAIPVESFVRAISAKKVVR